MLLRQGLEGNLHLYVIILKNNEGPKYIISAFTLINEKKKTKLNPMEVKKELIQIRSEINERENIQKTEKLIGQKTNFTHP